MFLLVFLIENLKLWVLDLGLGDRIDDLLSMKKALIMIENQTCASDRSQGFRC